MGLVHDRKEVEPAVKKGWFYLPPAELHTDELELFSAVVQSSVENREGSESDVCSWKQSGDSF